MTALSSFADEERENLSPTINLFSNGEKYTFIVTKADYLIGCDEKIKMTPEHISSMNYLSACNPGDPLIECGPDDCTFRITRQLIPYVKGLTCQLKASALSSDAIEDLSRIEGRHIDYGILMERTKRNKDNVDYARKVKSILMYTHVKGGFFVSHVTIIVNTQIPSFVTPLISQLTQFGYVDTSESTKKTRRYFDNKNNYADLIHNSKKAQSFKIDLDLLRL
jgi:hypothetical protein